MSKLDNKMEVMDKDVPPGGRGLLLAEERLPFTPETMPEKGREFQTIWQNEDGTESVYRGFHDSINRFIAMHGHPKAPRWRYV